MGTNGVLAGRSTVVFVVKNDGATTILRNTPRSPLLIGWPHGIREGGLGCGSGQPARG
jgi:hypothetical protein